MEQWFHVDGAVAVTASVVHGGDRLELADLFSCESSWRIWVPLNMFRP